MKEKATRLGLDVYRDLRDRRLLIIAVTLALAMLAVPFLVKGAEPEALPGTGGAAIAGLGEADELDPVVLVEGAELRDFQDRLDGVRSSNPFRQQLTGSGAPAADSGGGAAESGNLPTEESLSTATESTVGAVPTTGSIASEESFPTESAAPADPAETDPEADPSEPVPVSTLVTFTVDLKVGPVGDTQVIEDVEEGEIVPGKNRPVLIYAGSEPDESASSFVLSRDVIGASGEGNCAPNRASCDFLRLGVGEEQQLELATTGATYRVKLLGITRHEEPISEEKTEAP